MFFNFYLLGIHNKSCVASATLWWNIIYHDLGMVIGSARLLFPELNITYVLPVVFTIDECGVVEKFEEVVRFLIHSMCLL